MKQGHWIVLKILEKMEIKHDYTRVFRIEMMADDEEGYDEITPFLSAMQKIHEDSSAIGFVNRFTPNERTVLKGIWENIKENAQTVIEADHKKAGEGIQSTRIQNT